MIDFIPLKDFLASMAPVSQTNYQIWGSNGEMVFSTGGVMPDKPLVEEFQHLTSKVIEQKAFRYTSRDGCDFLCGIPIKNGQGIFGALLAFGRIPDEFQTDLPCMMPGRMPRYLTPGKWKTFSAI
ncbi:MAG: hypothetical protein JRJ20_16165 [Deltaproteobacteria bacterium]|nr:hypothetical protein [Deltaproteobacteria bacterium]